MYNLVDNHKRGSLVQLAILLALCFMLTMLLTACGNAEEEEPTPAGATVVPTATAVPPTATRVPPTATPVPTPSKVTPTLETSTQADGPDYWPTDGWRSSTPEE